jgi:hypothetical protein
MKWYRIPRFLHALWWMVIVFGVAYVFFVKTPGMQDWRVDAICAAGMTVFIAGAVWLYRLMFRKKMARHSPTATRPKRAPVDVVQRARDNAR